LATRKRGLYLWIVIVCVLAAVGSSFFTVRFLGSKTRTGEPEVPESNPLPGPVLDAGIFTVDLVPEYQGAARLVRVNVVLRTTSPKAMRELAKREAEIKHVIVTVLRGRTPSSLVGRAGMESLGREIRDTVNAAIAGDQITDVYFPELVMQ
jgi:flagellar basal body-associated protein FliL